MTDTTVSAEPTETTIKRFLCRHILTSGSRCGSPALRGEPFCYYHHTTRRPAPRHRGVHPAHAVFELPAIDDRAGVQFALAQILARVATNQLDHKRSGRLLTACFIACSKPPPRTPLRQHIPHRQPRLPPLPPGLRRLRLRRQLQPSRRHRRRARPRLRPRPHRAHRRAPPAPGPRSRRRRPPPHPRQPARRPLPSQPHPHPRPHPACGCPILGRRSHRRTGWGREWSRRNH